MRTFVLVAAFLVLVLTGAVRSAETVKPTTNTGPTEVNGKTLKEWVEEIDKNKVRDPGFRQRAIQAVTLFNPEMASKEAGLALIKSIDDPDTAIRVNALMALEMIGIHKDHTKAALAALRPRLTGDSQGMVRLHSALVLAQLDTAGREAIPDLIERSKDLSSYEIRKACVIALASIGQADEKNPLDMRAVGALVNVAAGSFAVAADTSAEVRLTAVSALGQMGVPQTPQEKAVLVNGLKAALKDPQKVIQIWARASLIHVDGFNEKYLKDIMVYLRGDDANAKVEALRALGAVGSKAAEVCFSDVAELLVEKDPGLVAGAAVTLATWGEVSEKAIPALEKLIAAKDTHERLKPILTEAVDRIKGKKKP